ncbi:MAG: signal peptidase I [Firmicutes bacterium]|nr:signal peptidase I [Bacillota bacterium]
MKNKKFLVCLIILFVMALIQSLIFVLPTSVIPVYNIIVRPAAYGILLAFTLIYWGIDLGCSRRKKPENAVLLTGALIYVVMLSFAVLAASFRQNYAIPDAGVFLENIWRYLPVAVMGEILRFQILKNTDKKHQLFVFILIVLVYSFTMLENAGEVAGGTWVHWVNLLAVTLLPICALNLFLTYVCRNGALIGIVSLHNAFALTLVCSPLLTDITRIVLAVFLCVAVIAMFFFCSAHAKIQKKRLKLHRSNTKWAISAASVLIAAVCVVFAVGILPFAPVAVASNSMKGAGADNFVRGDMLIVRKLSAEKAVKTLKTGDIIVYHSVDKDIIHRVIEIKTDFRGNTQYITKGDNREDADEEPVTMGQIVGIATFKVPLMGFPSVLLMELNTP